MSQQECYAYGAGTAGGCVIFLRDASQGDPIDDSSTHKLVRTNARDYAQNFVLTTILVQRATFFAIRLRKEPR